VELILDMLTVVRLITAEQVPEGTRNSERKGGAYGSVQEFQRMDYMLS